MKKLFTILTAACVIAACNDSSDTETTTTKDTSTNRTNDTINTVNAQPLDSESQTFVIEAAKDGMMEVELGNVAQQNARNQRVKDFAAMMVRDHTAANQELMQIASTHNVTLPSASDTAMQKHKTDLQAKSGSAFDKAYMKMMVDDHQKAVDKFQKVASSGTDATVKAFAEKTLPTLRMHLDSAKAISKLKL